MRIYQVVTTLGYGDAVGNDILALLDALKMAGYETGVFAECVDKRIHVSDVSSLDKMPRLNESDILLYHLATGAELNVRIAEYPCKKVLVYHNVTPPLYFIPYNKQAVENCKKGLMDVSFLCKKVDYCLADSLFNKMDLVQMGCRCKIDVLPIMLNYSDYEQAPDATIMDALADDYENLLFVGRVAPNKAHEDVIAAYAMYKRYYNPKSRLILAGSYTGMENYYECLKNYVTRNQIEDVVFTGHISFQELLAYYRKAHVFLCMSRHEGFCVPLLEAMYFDIPIIAYDSTAVGETLGGSGVLLKSADPLEAAGWINRIHRDPELKKNIIYGQRERLESFSESRIKTLFLTYMKRYMGENV